MIPPEAPKRTLFRSGLLGEIGALIIFITAVCVIIVESIALIIISREMTADLRKEVERTTVETASILEVPLYILDDEQCIRIGQTLLSSGRISGIKVVSSYSDVLLDVPASDPQSTIESRTGTIFHKGLLLGSYRFDFSDRQIRETNRMIINVFFWVIMTMIVSIILAIRFILVKRIGKAVLPIIETLDLIRQGDYSARIPESRHLDVNRIILNINNMTDRIEEKSAALVKAKETLEQKVEERTEALSRSIEELEKAQARLVQSEKMSALGNISAGIAHELNTPLGAILSSNRLIIDFLNCEFPETLRDFAALDEPSRERFLMLYNQIRKSARNFDLSRSMRKQRLAAEKELTSWGIEYPREIAEQFVDLGLNTGLDIIETWPTNDNTRGILDRACRAAMALRMAVLVKIAGEKAADVVSALRGYLSHVDMEDQDEIDLEAAIDEILTLMQNLLKQGISVRKEYHGIMAKGSAEKLGQVWLNIIRNAAQAMNFKGTLTIRTERADDSSARISFTDTGPGIPEQIQSRIFEPFFSTKGPGEGIGIGLDICKRIIEAHQGTISFNSKPGHTVFTVTLPGTPATSGPATAAIKI